MKFATVLATTAAVTTAAPSLLQGATSEVEGILSLLGINLKTTDDKSTSYDTAINLGLVQLDTKQITSDDKGINVLGLINTAELGDIRATIRLDRVLDL